MRSDLRHGRVVDLIALSRAAVARSQPSFPPELPAVPEVTGGTLFIGGGGALPGSAIKRFIEVTGGAEALIVVIPTAIGGDGRATVGRRDARMLRQAGASRVRPRKPCAMTGAGLRPWPLS